MLERIKSEWDKWTRLTPTNAMYDRTLIWLFIILLVIGFVMVTSASIPVAAQKYKDPLYFSIRDAAYVVISLIVFSFFIQISSEKWEKMGSLLLGISILLLVVVWIFGVNVNGAKRWIPLGPITFQPAELAKLALICYFARFYVRRFDEIRQEWYAFWRPSIVLSIFVGLLMAQPDLGSSAVLFVLTFLMLFIMGAKLLQFFFLGGIGAVIFAILIYTSEYRMKRMTSFMDPFADAYGDGFQLSNSHMAFGQGELFGQGIGNSIQKLSYLPEAHTDFVLSVIAEEFGLFGITIMILLLVILTFRALIICKQSLLLEERFRGFFSFGIAAWIFLQGFVNLGVASGLLPTKGLTFPLVSYGGSSLIVMSIAIAVLVRIDHENRLDKIGHAHLNDD